MLGLGLGNNKLSKPLNVGYELEAQAYFDATALAGYPVSDAYKIKYNSFITYLKNTGDWNLLDSFYGWATGDVNWAQIDVKTPTRTCTLQNDYIGKFTTDQGFNGNGSFAILTNFNPGDGGTYNFTQNDASFGILILDNDSAEYVHELSCMNAGFTQGMVIQAYAPYGNSDLNSVLIPVDSYIKYRMTSYCWQGNNRTDANLCNVYVNGFNTQTQTSSSTAIENKNIALMGAYNGAFVGGFYTQNSHAIFYAGGGNVSQKNIINAWNYAFNYNNITNITKRIIFEGDSRTGSALSFAQSVNSAYPRAVITAMGAGWSGCIAAEANDQMQAILTQAATEIDPFRNTSLQKDIIYLFAGTNDIENGRTGVQLYGDILSWATARKALGFKIVIFGEIDRNWSSYAAMDAERDSLRTLMAADFSVSEGINIYSGAAYADLYVDLYAETGFQSYLSADYMIDGIHPSASGAAIIAGYGITVGGML